MGSFLILIGLAILAYSAFVFYLGRKKGGKFSLLFACLPFMVPVAIFASEYLLVSVGFRGSDGLGNFLAMISFAIAGIFALVSAALATLTRY